MTGGRFQKSWILCCRQKVSSKELSRFPCRGNRQKGENMEKTVKMTVAQAIVKFLDNQYVSMDGVETKFVEGFFTIFGI